MPPLVKIMEENYSNNWNFYGTNENGQQVFQQNPDTNNRHYTTANELMEDSNVFERFFQPGIAENAAFQRELYTQDRQNDFQEYMWNKSNEYNTPAAQLERAKAAGINPMLAASTIGGGNAGLATPMQGGSASVGGMNVNAENPFNTINSIFDMFGKGVNGIEGLGRLLGFGKENKANIKVAEATAENYAEQTNKTKWETKQIKKTFRAYIRTAEANADQAEQQYKNLQKLYESYEQDIKTKKAQENLYTEQANTQEKLTKTQEYINWEYQFKKQFRDIFGVQLNESDLSMLVQTMMNGQGEQIINSLGTMLRSVFKGIGKEIKDSIIPNMPKIRKPKEITINDQNDKGKPKTMHFKSTKQAKKWAKSHYKYAKKEWQAHGEKGSFSNHFEIYCKKRGLDYKQLKEILTE
ncbi:MAG: hypothetical protein II669_03255 [Elusimicrobia bacterium]|nr:hypothetical protein [Elusimicrobiota bacterium]